MSRQAAIRQKLGKVFREDQAEVLAGVITEAYEDLVKTSDFNELKGIVKEQGSETWHKNRGKSRLSN